MDFTGHWYFQNTYGALPDVEIEQDDKLEEMWGKMGAEIKSAFLTMLNVTPEYIVVVSNPAEIIVDEDASEIILPLRGYIAARLHIMGLRLERLSDRGKQSSFFAYVGTLLRQAFDSVHFLPIYLLFFPPLPHTTSFDEVCTLSSVRCHCHTLIHSNIRSLLSSDLPRMNSTKLLLDNYAKELAEIILILT